MKHRWLSFLSLFLVPSAAHACAVCFGGGDSNLTRGFFWGILIMLILPFALMGGLITAIVRSTRRKAAR